MLFVIIAYDGPEGPNLRPKIRPLHLDYVNRFAAQGKLALAGPFTDGAGSLLIIDVADEGEAREFSANDPYKIHGVFERVEIRPFRRVYPE